ncbi:tetratricopeptide repeat protein [Pseudoalteromonas sp. DY56-GL79]|uniref:tetratricopeptide repeat protein n=1 Tax=Pseudoalteromonas sp. DY56-GL79 TaxID=2967131 RepID=UPI003529D965
MKWLLIILTSIGLSGCNSTHTTTADMKQKVDVTSLFNHSLFALKSVPSEQQIFTLPKQEEEALLTYVERFRGKNVTKDEILGNFLQAKIGHFSYDGETFIASELLNQQSGNCISLAILSQAYANILGIETSYAKVDSFPIYQKNQNFVLTSSHFKTKLITPKEELATLNNRLSFSGTVVDYFPEQDSVFSGNAQYEDLVAKFYTNLAVSALLEADYDMSYSLLSAALKYAPRDAEAINIAALLHKHVGDRNSAKQIYDYAFNNHLTSTNLLLNYLNYIPKDQTNLKNMILAELEQSPTSPFDTLSLASSYIKQQRYKKAKELIEPLLLNYHYLPEVYVELGKIAYLEQRYQTASEYFEQAVNKSREQYKKDLYTAKQKMLNHLLVRNEDIK